MALSEPINITMVAVRSGAVTIVDIEAMVAEVTIDSCHSLEGGLPRIKSASEAACKRKLVTSAVTVPERYSMKMR